jgi:hypothetical protein
MRFFTGALALAVICVLVGTPAAFVLGWSPLSATKRQHVNTPAKNESAPVSNASSETGVTIRPKGRYS